MNMKSLNTQLKGKFFEDLSQTILGFLQKHDLPFYVNGEKITQQELVGETCLPFLLYDKQPMIDRMIEDLNSKHGFLGYLIITFKNKSKRKSLADLYLNVEENISSKVELQDDYRHILLNLTKAILSQNDFVMENGKILLDNLMNKFLAAFDNGELLVESEDNAQEKQKETQLNNQLVDAQSVKLTDLVSPELLAKQVTLKKQNPIDIYERLNNMKEVSLFKIEDNSKFLELPVMENKFIKSVTPVVATGALQIALPTSEEVQALSIHTIEQKVRKLTELITLKDNLININEKYGQHFNNPVIEDHLIYNIEKEIKQLAEDINNT